jgi:hypothetical protein
MNERIKELEQQCVYWVAYEETYEFDRGKFAELIVRECLHKIENEAAQYAEPVWALELVNDIKERFGVKE